MLKYVLLAAVVATALAFPVSVEDPKCAELFEQFLIDHPREYANDVYERTRRAKIFCNNVATQLTGQHDWEGITEMFDLTYEEFSLFKLNGGKVTDVPSVVRNCLKNNASQPHFFETNALPTAFDWRTKGAVTAVKNQASCGSCWAFSTAGNMEGQYFLKTGKLVDLSPQDLVDCSHDCSWEIFPPGSGTNLTVCNSGCGGGWPWMAYETIRKQKGLDTEVSYPYKGTNQPCAFVQAAADGPLKNFTCVDSNEDQIAAFLMNRGPLSIAVNANPFFSYQKGILNPPNGTSTVLLNHAILLVGWGVDNVVPPSGGPAVPTKYWIVKNSWGTTWGEAGYVRVIRGIGALGLNNAVSTADLA